MVAGLGVKAVMGGLGRAWSPKSTAGKAAVAIPKGLARAGAKGALAVGKAGFEKAVSKVPGGQIITGGIGLAGREIAGAYKGDKFSLSMDHKKAGASARAAAGGAGTLSGTPLETLIEGQKSLIEGQRLLVEGQSAIHNTVKDMNRTLKACCKDISKIREILADMRNLAYEDARGRLKTIIGPKGQKLGRSPWGADLGGGGPGDDDGGDGSGGGGGIIKWILGIGAGIAAVFTGGKIARMLGVTKIDPKLSSFDPNKRRTIARNQAAEIKGKEARAKFMTETLERQKRIRGIQARARYMTEGTERQGRQGRRKLARELD